MPYINALKWLNMSPEGQAMYTPKKLTLRDLQTIRKETGHAITLTAMHAIDEARTEAMLAKRPKKVQIERAKQVLTKKEQKEILKHGNEVTLIKEAAKKREKHYQKVMAADFERRKRKARPTGDTIRRDYDYDASTGEYKEKRRESTKHTKLGDPIVQYTNMLDKCDAPASLINKFVRTTDGLEDNELDMLLYELPTEEALYKALKGKNESLLDEMFQQINEVLDTYADYIDDEDFDKD